MRKLFPSSSGQSSLRVLLGWNLGICLAIFVRLQFWRPCYFLTDDNLSGGFPFFTGVGRALKAGRSPFVSDYLFGGHYNYLRDLDAVQWHPFFVLPSLLADTAGRFWIMDIAALLFLLLATAGFTVLAHALREELSLKIPDAYLVFYTLSFVFCTFILTVGPSWLNFLGNISALPWLVLGIMDRKVWRGTLTVVVFTAHEILVAYPPLTVSTGLCLTLFAICVARWKGSFQHFFSWCAGNMIALLVLSPLMLSILDGFSHSPRIQGLSLRQESLFSIPLNTVPFSFLLGNWAEPFALWRGDTDLNTVVFPYLSSILACAAAWCLLPAIVYPRKWRSLEKICAGIALVIMLFVVRPDWLAMTMSHLPFFRSMRWPFREGILFLFFVHIFLVLRFPERPPWWTSSLALFSAVIFILPLPFIRVPTLNALFLDRQYLFSGKADKFWAEVKTQLKPSDQIITVIDWEYFNAHAEFIPYTLLGTADFPTYFKVRCISGYSPTAPIDQLPIPRMPGYWFGAYRPDQLKEILDEHPGLKVLRVENVQPLKITMSTGTGPAVDLTPELKAAGIIEPATDPAPSSGR